MERLTFMDCLMVAARQPGFVAEFDRLTGNHLSELARRSPLDEMIDEATGYQDKQLRAFIEFVWDYVWTRLPRDVVADEQGTV